MGPTDNGQPRLTLVAPWRRGCRGQRQKQGEEVVVIIQVRSNGNLAQVAAVEGMGGGQVLGHPKDFGLNTGRQSCHELRGGRLKAEQLGGVWLGKVGDVSQMGEWRCREGR